MPKQVDHHERRQQIARALWTLVGRRGLQRVSLRDVATEAGISLGQLQHYFGTREAMLTFAMTSITEETAGRVQQSLDRLGDSPHPRDVLRILVVEMLPLHEDARVTSQMSAAYVLEALHNNEIRTRAAKTLTDGRAVIEQVISRAVADNAIPTGCDPGVEADLLMGLTGFTTLLELGVLSRASVLRAVEDHLDRLFEDPLPAPSRARRRKRSTG